MRASQRTRRGKSRHSHQRSERHPVSRDAIGTNGAQLNRAKSRGPETSQRIDYGNGRVRVFEHQAAVAEREGGPKAAVDRRKLYLFRAWKRYRHTRTQEEDQPSLK